MQKKQQKSSVEREKDTSACREKVVRVSPIESKKSALSRSKSDVSEESAWGKNQGSLTAPYSMFAIMHPEAEFMNT